MTTILSSDERSEEDVKVDDSTLNMLMNETSFMTTRETRTKFLYILSSDIKRRKASAFRHCFLFSDKGGISPETPNMLSGP